MLCLKGTMHVYGGHPGMNTTCPTLGEGVCMCTPDLGTHLRKDLFTTYKIGLHSCIVWIAMESHLAPLSE